MKTYNLPFSPNDPVKIKPIQAKGRVSGVFIGPHYTEYKVRYFEEMTSHDEYFNEDELEWNGDEMEFERRSML